MSRDLKALWSRRRADLTVPNAISASRIVLAGLFPIASDGGRVVIVAAAAASDWVDGRIARAEGQTTRLGEVLDPIADKLFMVTVLVTLAATGRLPLWTLPLLLMRDIGVVAGALRFAARGTHVRMRARTAGKAVTWLQFAAVGAILIWPASAPWIAPLVAVAGLVALRDYARSLQRTG
jgi:CDP-diacylglycerol--glycerol-3-phosphate 3-phosphatidyltransferase